MSINPHLDGFSYFIVAKPDGMTWRDFTAHINAQLVEQRGNSIHHRRSVTGNLAIVRVNKTRDGLGTLIKSRGPFTWEQCSDYVEASPALWVPAGADFVRI